MRVGLGNGSADNVVEIGEIIVVSATRRGGGGSHESMHSG